MSPSTRTANNNASATKKPQQHRNFVKGNKSKLIVTLELPLKLRVLMSHSHLHGLEDMNKRVASDKKPFPGKACHEKVPLAQSIFVFHQSIWVVAGCNFQFF